MAISRRDFLRASGAGVGGILLNGLINPSAVTADNSFSPAGPSHKKAILYDSMQCVGCHMCEGACRTENELYDPDEMMTADERMAADDQLSPDVWLKIVQVEPRQDEEEAEPRKFPELSEIHPDSQWFFENCMRQACMHCSDAACVKVCPTGALYHHELGFVAQNKSLCIGCGYCADYCPFKIPQIKPNLITGVTKMYKCTFCKSRVANGDEPACVEICPVGALKYDDRDRLMARGNERVEALKAEGHSNAYLYGEKELGGLQLLYVLNDSPETRGLPDDPKIPATATIWQNIVQPVGWVLGALAILGLGANYFIARKNMNKKREE